MRNSLPIREYKNLEHLKQGLKEWQKRLFLDSWVIGIKFHKIDEIAEEGHVDFRVIHKTAVISLLKDDPKDRITKKCQELVLIHELLHLKFGWLEPPNSLEGNFYDVMNHQLIDEIAKSLIMAKYNLKFDWFRNF